MTAPAYPYDATTLAALQRMGLAGGVGSYNSGVYDAVVNTLGFASGGHRQNFPAALADEAQVGAAIALAAVYCATEAALATTNGAAQVALATAQVALAAAFASQVTTVKGTVLFAATAGQTTFTGLSYVVGSLNCYVNGVRLTANDFTATDGSTAVLSACRAGDVVFFENFASGYIDSNVVEKTTTASYTMVNRDNIVARTDTAGGTIPLLLPASPAQGYECWVAQVGGSTVTVGVNGSTGSAAFTAGTYTLAASSGACVRFIYTGGQWRAKTDGVLS